MADLASILTATDSSENGDLPVSQAARLSAEQRVPLELITVANKQVSVMLVPGQHQLPVLTSSPHFDT